MLPSRSRLNLSKISFKKFGGKRITNEDFTLLAKNADEFKAAVIISKKVASRAVDRNRIKRTITEALRNQNEFEGEIIITVRRNLAKLNSHEVQSKLEKLISKL